MALGFDDLPTKVAEHIKARILAGDTMADVRVSAARVASIQCQTKLEFTARQMRALRDEVFEPLLSDPEEVKKLANGRVLNALDIIRYRQRPGRKTRMARPGAVQTEMFPA